MPMFRVFFGYNVTAAGNITVTPSTLALTLTTFAPTVSTPRLVTPSTLALVTETFAPTVSTPRLVTPSTASLTTTTFEPTVSTPRLVTPLTLALSLTTFEPTVTATGAAGAAGGGGLKHGRVPFAPQYPLRIPREPQAPRTRPDRQPVDPSHTFRTRDALLGEWPVWTLVADATFTAGEVERHAAPASAVEFPAWTLAADVSASMAAGAVVLAWPAWSLAGEGRHRDQRRVRARDEAFLEMMLLLGDE